MGVRSVHADRGGSTGRLDHRRRHWSGVEFPIVQAPWPYSGSFHSARDRNMVAAHPGTSSLDAWLAAGFQESMQLTAAAGSEMEVDLAACSLGRALAVHDLSRFEGKTRMYDLKSPAPREIAVH